MYDQYENNRVGNRSNNKTLGIQEKEFLDIDPETMKTNYQQWWMAFQNAGRQELGPGWGLLFPDNGARQLRVMEALPEEVQESNGAQTTFEYTRGGGLSPYKTPMIRMQGNQHQDNRIRQHRGPVYAGTDNGGYPVRGVRASKNQARDSTRKSH